MSLKTPLGVLALAGGFGGTAAIAANATTVLDSSFLFAFVILFLIGVVLVDPGFFDDINETPDEQDNAPDEVPEKSGE